MYIKRPIPVEDEYGVAVDFLGRRDAHVLKSLDVRLRGGRQGERGEDASRHCSGAGEIMGCT